MSRKCSHCGNNGHNSRTCVDIKADGKAGSGGGFKLFGVRFSPETTVMATTTTVTTECSSSSSSTSHHQQQQQQQSYSNLMRKSVSMGNLSNYGSTDAGASPPNFSSNEHHELGDDVEGYASDDLVHTNSSSRERKKGVAWTEEEHRAFLMGLQKLGKGDWRGISRKFVKTRTPTQVASHAQKYFLRRNTGNKRRRRSSLFDITADPVIEEPVIEETGSEDADVCPELSLGQSIPYGNPHGMEVTQLSLRGGSFGAYTAPPQCMPHTIPEQIDVTDKDMEMNVPDEAAIVENSTMLHVESTESDSKQMPAFQYIPFIPIWPMQAMNQDLWMPNSSRIVRPTPVVPRPPAKVDETMQESDRTTNNVTRPVMEPTPLSLKLQEEGTRHSAFHTASSNQTSRELDGQGNLTNAISVP